MAGLPIMNGARVLEGYVPIIDATIVTRLLDAGATIVGKPACADFSGGGHTSGYGPVRNPRKPTHAPGGSSKGSAAALAAGDVAMAIGGDQGGSIRIPASWFGVVGHKTTYGLIPYTGCLAIEMTLDHIGPMANNVENTARMLSVLVGPDPLDPRQRGTIPEDYVQDYMPAIGAGCEGIRIGVLSEGFGQTTETWPEFGLPGREPAVAAWTLGSTADRGYLHCGPPGSGHFVKMIHNGIEYGLMQAYAEGLDILRSQNTSELPEAYRFELNIADITELWRRGSVVSSWLLDLTAMALAESPHLEEFSGFVQDSGEGRWTVQAAVEAAVPADVLSASLYARFRSRQEHTFADKVLSAMRKGFGGHVEAPSK